MSNMSYCRFQNTNGDLADCQEALEELFNEGTKLSDRELRAARKLVERCKDILQLVADQAGADLNDAESFYELDTDAALEKANAAATEKE